MTSRLPACDHCGWRPAKYRVIGRSYDRVACDTCLTATQRAAPTEHTTHSIDQPTDDGQGALFDLGEGGTA